MRFRLGTMGGGGTQQLGDGFGRGMQALFMAPLIRAQAQEEADYAGARRRLVESQIAENMAQAAIRQQEEQQLAQRGGVLDLMGATRAGMSVPEFRAGLQERQQGAPIVGPSVLHNREQPFNDAITTLYGPAMATPAGKLNWDQLANARGKYQQQDVLDTVLAGQRDPALVGQGYAAIEGKPLVDNVGTSGRGFNRFTGAGQVIDAGMAALFDQGERAGINRDNAAAGASNASAGLSGARRERVVGGYDKPVTILDEDTGNAQITRIPTGQAPVTVGVSPKKATGVDATNAKERNRVVRDVEKELVGATDEEIEAEVDRRMARRGAKAPAPPKPAGQSIDMKRAAQIKADVKAGRMTREQGIAELRKLGFQ